jgi:hypothetical protein
MESGEQNPDVDTIIATVGTLGTEFVLDVAPAERGARLVTKGAQTGRRGRPARQRGGHDGVGPRPLSAPPSGCGALDAWCTRSLSDRMESTALGTT